MSDALSNLKDHAPSMPSASDVRDAVKAHVPSIDTSAIADRLPKAGGGKRKLLAVVGALAAAAAAFGIVRRRRSPETASNVYTPPLPRP
jgi:LPXTG-motif cell wall-anchored protein